ncbi:MAG: CARDB domain-containing protein [Halobacteriales archaeon]|nr:CARDB domain-containing protein [Halobacteriales archaeon]
MVRNRTLIVFVTLAATLFLLASVGTVAAQGTVSIDGPDEPVAADGDFDFTVTMTDSSLGEVAVESSDFGVDLSVVDDDGDSISAQTDTSVEFIDIVGEDSTYTLNVDITGGSEGDTGTITAATGSNIGGSNVDDQQSVSFSITDAAPEFSISNLNPVNADVTEGEIITVSAVIENTGDATGSATVDLTLDGSVADSTTTGNLAPGVAQTVSFSVDTGAVGAGSFVHGIQTADDSQTGSLTIESEPAGIRGTDRSGSVFAPNDVDDVFQGEDIEFTQTLSGIPDGGASGEVLEDDPIPANQDTGIYAANGDPNNPTVTVRQPRVQTLEVIDTNGNGVTEVSGNQPVLVGVDFNYEDAEPIKHEIFDNAGDNVFDDINSNANFGDLTPDQEASLSEYDARYALSFNRAGDYELTISPDGDGNVGQVDSATRSEVLTVISKISINSPDTVQPDGDFDFTVEMMDSGVGEVAVESSDFGVDLSVVDADGDSIGAQTDTSVEFIDLDGDDSTYTLNVDVTGGSEGDTGTITAATGGNIGDSDVDDEISSTFSLEDVVESPVEGVSDELWAAVIADDDEEGLSLSDLGNAIQEYQSNPGNADVDGVSIDLSDLGSLIQYYQNEVA